jgi:conjugal transfer ATP-binding protein TraC
MSAPLVEKIEIWGFEAGFTIFTDGSLGFGLETTALDISCWDDGKIDSIGPSLTSFLNGLPTRVDLQFVLNVGRGDGSRIKEHLALEVSEDATVKSLTENRANRFLYLEEQGLVPKHRLQIFVRRPFSDSTRLKSGLFSQTVLYPNIAETTLKREISSTNQLRDDLTRQLTALGLEVKHLSDRETASLVYAQWNPARVMDLKTYDPEDVRGSLLFTDVSVSEKGFSLSDVKYRVLSLKTLPDQTFSAMAKALGTLPFDSQLFLTVHVPDQQKELESLQTSRRLAFSMARGKQTGVSDIESEAKFRDLEELVGEMIAQGERVFHVSLNIVLRGKSDEELHDRVTQALTTVRELGGAEGMEETLAAFDVFCELSIPHARSKERQKRIKTSNLIDFLPLYGPWEGHKDPRILLRSIQGDLVGIDPFAKELTNYNQMITGGSGSGKSFMTNLCLLQMLKENPRIFIVDIGGSYKKLCENLSGQYIPFHLNTGISLNPFDLNPGETLPSSQKIKFLVGLVEMMTKEDEMAHIGKLERAEIEEAIQRVYETVKSPRLSDLKDLLLKHSETQIRRFGRIMAPWCGETPYGKVVDRITTIELTRSVVCFDLKGLEIYPDLQAVCLYLITDYVWREVQLERGRMKFLVLDECWKLLESASGASFIGEVFRTFRKYYAGAIAISQNIDDFAKSKVASAILPNTSIKWVLSQRGADTSRLKDVLQLNDNELSWIAHLHQERGVYSQAFLMAGEQHAVVAIEPTPLEYWIATTDPRDLAKFEEIQKQSPELSQLEVLTLLSEQFPRGVVAR